MNNCSFSVLNTDVFGKVSVWWQPRTSRPVCDRYSREQGPAPTFPCIPRPWLRSLASFRCWECLRCKSFQIEHQNRILLESELVCKMWVKLCGLIENAQIRLFLFSWLSDPTTCQHYPHMGKWDLADHINWALKWEGQKGGRMLLFRLATFFCHAMAFLSPSSMILLKRPQVSLDVLCQSSGIKPCADSSEALPLLQLEISSMNWRRKNGGKN